MGDEQQRAVLDRLAAVLPAPVLDQLVPYLTREFLHGLTDLAAELEPAPWPGGRGQHAVTFGDIYDDIYDDIPVDISVHMSDDIRDDISGA